MVRLVELQILDEQSLDENRPFLDEVRLHPVDVVVDEVLRHLLKMGYYLDVVDEVPRHLLQMDCFPDEALAPPVLVQLLLEPLLHRLRDLPRDLPPPALQPLPYVRSTLPALT